MLQRISGHTNYTRQNDHIKKQQVSFGISYKSVDEIVDVFMKQKLKGIKTPGSIAILPNKELYKQISGLESPLDFIKKIFRKNTLKNFNNTKTIGDCWAELAKRGIKEVESFDYNLQPKIPVNHALSKYNDCFAIADKLGKNDVIEAKIKQIRHNYDLLMNKNDF